MSYPRPVTFAAACVALVVAFAVIAGMRFPPVSAQTAARSANPPNASAFSTFYCHYPFDQYTPFFHLDPSKKVPLYVGTNPKQFRLAVHDPAGAAAVAILGGSTNVSIPNIPATVDVEAPKIEIQNNGTQPADVCYYYVQ